MKMLHSLVVQRLPNQVIILRKLVRQKMLLLLQSSLWFPCSNRVNIPNNALNRPDDFDPAFFPWQVKLSLGLLRKSLNTIFYTIIMGPNIHSLLQYPVAGGPRFNDSIQFRFIHSLSLLRLI
jgi:hypothetical protein